MATYTKINKEISTYTKVNKGGGIGIGHFAHPWFYDWFSGKLISDLWTKVVKEISTYTKIEKE